MDAPRVTVAVGADGAIFTVAPDVLIWEYDPHPLALRALTLTRINSPIVSPVVVLIVDISTRQVLEVN